MRRYAGVCYFRRNGLARRDAEVEIGKVFPLRIAGGAGPFRGAVGPEGRREGFRSGRSEGDGKRGEGGETKRRYRGEERERNHRKVHY